MSDGRPAGGTARHPGNKTPRKVQWDDSSNQVEEQPTHELDEHGRDPTALKALTDALERHQSDKRPASRIHYFPPRQPDPRFRGVHESSSTTIPPRIDGNDIEIQAQGPSTNTTVSPGSSLGHITPPMMLTSTLERGASGSGKRRNPNFGIHGNYIGDGETAGLPRSDDPDEIAIRSASRVVRSHTRHRRSDFLGLKKRRGGRGARSVSPKRNGGYPPVHSQDFAMTPLGDPHHHAKDVEFSGQSPSSSGASRKPFGGVLSALLSLYDDTTTGQASGSSTPGYSTPSVFSTRSSSFDSNDDDVTRPLTKSSFKEDSSNKLDKVMENDKEQSGTTLHGPSSSQPHTASQEKSPVSPSSPSSPSSSTTTSPSSPTGSTTPSRKNRQSPTAKLLSAFDFSTDGRIRPAQARNAGGVIGSLIASTGNITGAAAPRHSEIQPNLKRPGYHLSRYSSDAITTTLLQGEEMEPLNPKSRPKSMQLESSAGMMMPTTTITTTTTTSSSGFNSSGGTSSPIQPPGIAHATNDTTTTKDKDKDKSTKWMGGILKDLPTGMIKLASSVVSTPGTDKDEWLSEKPKFKKDKDRDRDREKGEDERRKRKRVKRKEAEIFITRHVAQILARQEFICKLARAMMMFGAPSHRLQPQIQATARVLEIELSCMYLPDLMLLSFDDSVTSTSNIKFIRQGSALDLSKLDDSYDVFRKVIYDQVSVSEASNGLDRIMKSPQIYKPWQLCIFGGMCSAAICIVGFSGSFLDALMAFPMGATLVAFQLLSVRNELYSNIFEISIATLFSFLSAALATTKYFCYSALASGSVVLILPGFMVTLGSLELISRNMISGSVRLCYAVVYSLFLGFGLAMGAQAFEKMTGQRVVKLDDLSCSLTHYEDAPWYIQTPREWWYFLAVPMFALFLSMRNFAPWNSREIILLVLFACIGWMTNHFVSPYFEGQSDISAAVGAFAVGFIANVYARLFSKNAFVVMITGILFQVPSGLGNGGLLNYAEKRSNTIDEENSTEAYISGFQTALQLISVAIGLAIGLSISLVVVHPIPSRRLKAGVFSL